MQQKVALPGILELFKSSFKFSAKYWKEVLLIVGLPIGLQQLDNVFLFVVAPAFKNNLPLEPLLVIFGVIMIWVIELFFVYSTFVAYKFVLNVIDGEPRLGKAYLSMINMFFPVLWVFILVALSDFGTFILLIIPGIVAIVYMQFSTALVIDNKYRGIEALTASFELVRGNWWRIFGRILAVIISLFAFMFIVTIAVLGILHASSHSAVAFWHYVFITQNDIFTMVFNILAWFGSLVSFPYAVYLYRANLKAKESMISAEEINKSKSFFMGLSIWGTVAVFFFGLIFITVIILGTVSVARREAAAATATNQYPVSMVAYSDPTYGFSIQYPSDWQVLPSPGTPYSVFFIAPPGEYSSTDTDDALRGSVVVNVTQENEPQNLTELAYDFEAPVAQEAKTLNDQWTILSKQQTMFLGMPALQYVTTKLRTFDNGKTFVKQESQETVFSVGDLVYDIQLKGDLDNFDIISTGVGSQMLSTFKLKQ